MCCCSISLNWLRAARPSASSRENTTAFLLLAELFEPDLALLPLEVLLVPLARVMPPAGTIGTAQQTNGGWTHGPTAGTKTTHHAKQPSLRLTSCARDAASLARTGVLSAQPGHRRRPNSSSMWRPPLSSVRG